MSQHSGPPPVALVVSTCILRDLPVWRRAAPAMRRFIPAAAYEVVVPDADADAFRAATPAGYRVVPESACLPDRDLAWIRQRMPERLARRAGWYLQQFLKIAAAGSRGPDDVVVIWDADTVPLKPLRFVADDGSLLHFTGTERHEPYFRTLEALLGLRKTAEFSYIAQSLPARSGWVRAFCAAIEQRHGQPWPDAILAAVDHSHHSGFSEYESLGTFIAGRYPGAFRPNAGRWAYGALTVGGVEKLTDEAAARLAMEYDFIAFEDWLLRAVARKAARRAAQ